MYTSLFISRWGTSIPPAEASVAALASETNSVRQLVPYEPKKLVGILEKLDLMWLTIVEPQYQPGAVRTSTD